MENSNKNWNMLWALPVAHFVWEFRLYVSSEKQQAPYMDLVWKRRQRWLVLQIITFLSMQKKKKEEETQK